MNDGVQMLESYRLAQYALQVPCYLCQEGNAFDAELCRYCFAPMALAHQAISQKLQPKLLAVVGPSAVGKTVYLGMLLDMLARQPDRLQMLARGAYSITLQQTTAQALARCEFPAKTPNEPDRWHWVHAQVQAPGQRRALELVMPDLPGEALIEEVDHPHTYRGIRALLEKCAGVLVLIDGASLHAGRFDQDYFAMKLLSYLLQLNGHSKTGWPNRPIGLVLTKADQCEEMFLDPQAFARRHAAGLWTQCQQQFRRFRFFAASVAGGCAHRPSQHGPVRVPLRIEPRGVIEPFEWLLSQVKA